MSAESYEPVPHAVPGDSPPPKTGSITHVAVKIKLKRMGKVRAPHYRIVVADARTKRDGRAIEEIGNYRPTEEPSLIEVDSERVQYWLKVGAQPTEPVRAILRKTGDWQLFKGEPAPAPLKRPAPKADKQAVFDAAAKEAMGEAGSGAATTPRGKGGRKPKAADKTEAGNEAAATDESAEA